MMIDDTAAAMPQPEARPREKPETDPLARKWGERISAARKHWDKFHARVRHNRKTVAGFDWTKKPDSGDFYRLRANLIHGAIASMLPQIYARNPEISAVPVRKDDALKLFCETLEKVTNRELEQANLKQRAKSSVRAALTCSIGIVKVMYQRDYKRDPIIQSRIQDTQDNIATVEGLLADLEDPNQRGDQEAKLAELRQTMAVLEQQVEIVAAEGIVVDRVMTENLLIDPTITEFWDYRDADWMCQIVPMRRAAAEAQYGLDLSGAKSYRDAATNDEGRSMRYAGGKTASDEDAQIAVLEIWDRRSQSVYTMAEGCDFWLREPFAPERAGQRWYPFFLLPYQVVDGQFIGPSIVDLMEKLQDEHNEARNKFNQHRDLIRPGYVAGSEVSEKTLKRFTDAVMGEVTIVDTDGKPLQQVIQPRQHPPIDPAAYDTGPVRYDIEQVTGLQDAMRSTVVQPKTATEASIMQQGLSGRVSEFRDQVEDWLQEIAQYTAEILLQELTPEQVSRVMGERFDWPQLDREGVFDLVEMRIRAGTTGEPDKMEQQESWTKVLPIIQQLVTMIVQIQIQGGNADPIINILRETLARFDERLDVEQFIPKPPQPPMQPPMQPAQAMPPGMPMIPQ
jgi:hypothetical protein